MHFEINKFNILAGVQIMWELFNVFSDVSSYFHYTYTFWGLLFHKNFRKKYYTKFIEKTFLQRLLDLFLSLLFFILECYILYIVTIQLFK